MRSRLLTLAALSLMLSACASTKSTPSTAARPVPWECLARCDNPPALSMPAPALLPATRAWGWQCKRLHDDCVDAMLLQPAK